MAHGIKRDNGKEKVLSSKADVILLIQSNKKDVQYMSHLSDILSDIMLDFEMLIKKSLGLIERQSGFANHLEPHGLFIRLSLMH